MSAEPNADCAGQRIDKWLWYTRLVKSRSLAGNLARAGRVRINSARINKPSTMVRPGDVVTFVHNRAVRTLEVVLAGHRRGPFAEAVTLYRDLSPPRAKDSAESRQVPAPVTRTPGSGRPTKKQRRLLDQWLENTD